MKKKETVIIVDELTPHQTYTVGTNEKKTVCIFLVGDQDVTMDVNVQITGSGATVQIVGIIIGAGKQIIRLHTTQHHVQQGSVSDLLIKSVLFGKTRFFYNGNIVIDPGAQQSNAYQKNQNLLLSAGAWADSRPILEILANDVRCTHGVTIGTVDDEQLYYLANRGIGRREATALIVEGYIADVLDKIPDATVRNRLQSRAKSAYIGYLQERA